jgi:hypothetical protein
VGSEKISKYENILKPDIGNNVDWSDQTNKYQDTDDHKPDEAVFILFAALCSIHLNMSHLIAKYSVDIECFVSTVDLQQQDLQ